jgi:two-component system chemotaxis sensor kinase CheA
MDVVRANVEQVGGSVELESRVGSGTTVRMRVPLTLAIVPALVVRSGGQSFALPQNALIEVVYVAKRDAKSQVEQIAAVELYPLRDGLLPLVWLDRLLDMESASAGSPGFYIAVLESEGRRFGLVVDDLKAQEEIVVKSLSAVLREIGLFSGATVLGNGTLAMVLDVAETGARAGVRAAAEEVKVVDAESALAETGRVEQTWIAMANSVVVYETWSGVGNGRRSARMAMPLSAVERVENVPIAEIEFAGGRPVLQYGGELLPLEDEDDILLEMTAASPSAEACTAAAATIMICQRPGEHRSTRVGVVVRRVVDVSSGALLDATTQLCAQPLAMVKGRVTTLHPGFAAYSALPRLQEVA